MRGLISEDGALAAVNVVVKMFYREDDGQQFAIESAILLLSVGEFPAKEGDRVPDNIEKLFKLATNCPVGGIHQDAGTGIQVRALEEGGRHQSRLGRNKN